MTTEQAELLVNEWRVRANKSEKKAKTLNDGPYSIGADLMQVKEEARAQAYRYCAHKLEEMLKQDP